ncbi:MAG: hypothetical protein V1754_01165 [Pseudomonadota bacterium]
MMDELKAEGLKDLEFVAVTMSGVDWVDHAAGFDVATFPVMPDISGMYSLYSAEPYDVFLVDKKGRLVSKEGSFSVLLVDELNKRIRELHAE